MQIAPYLNFKGQCREAMSFYAEVLGGQVEAMFTHGETPAAEFSPPEAQDLIMHARIRVGDAVLMASDAMGGCGDGYEKPQGMWVSFHPDTPEQAERIFAALEEGGTVVMPIQETFWAARFGMVTDRFGTPWMINCENKG